MNQQKNDSLYLSGSLDERENKNNNNKEVDKAIEEIKRGLTHLSLALNKVKASENFEKRQSQQRLIRVSDKVQITNNIKKGQAREGVVVKINKKSGFVTVSGRNNSGDVRRLRKNLRRLD